MKAINLIAVSAVLCLSVSSVAVATAMKKTLAGKEAPAIRLEVFSPDRQEAPVSLSSVLDGNNVVVLSFFDTTCEPCEKELPALEKIHKKFTSGVKIFLISLDENYKNKLPGWIKKNRVTIPVLIDPLGHRAGGKYGVTKYGQAEIPQTFVIGKDGIIKKHLKGYHPDIEKILEETIQALQKETVVSPSASTKKTTINIIYTHSANGYLESCDCPENPFGGLVRRVTAIKKLKARYPDAVTVDTGDTFPPRENKILAEYCLKIMESIGYDAVGVGDQEFICGADFLMKNIKRLPFIASNIQTCDDKLCYPLAEPYLLKQIGPVSIVFISVIDSSVFDLFPDDKTKQIKTSDYIEYLKQTIPEIRKEADMVVLLSHCGDDTDRKIAEEIPGIDVIIGGHSQTFHKDPLKVGNTIIVQGGENGHRVGRLELTLGPPPGKKIISYSNEFVILNKDVQDDPPTRELVTRYNDELKKSLRKIIIK
ncbi:MAG: redoxin domain-containing protein [Elusimicrobiota bacterium]